MNIMYISRISRVKKPLDDYWQLLNLLWPELCKVLCTLTKVRYRICKKSVVKILLKVKTEWLNV